MKSKIVFANEKLQNSLNKLKNSKTEDKKLYSFLERAFFDLESNPFCGIQIPKKLIPKDYLIKLTIYGNITFQMPGDYYIQLNKELLLF